MEDHQQRYERAHALGVFGFGGGPLGSGLGGTKDK
jgi:hypothetical protein